MRAGDRAQRGFTYVAVLISVALVGVGLMAVGELWSANARRARSEQLQWVGQEYREAIGRYYESSPGTVKRYPSSLDDLLIDHRYVTVRRHLRRHYANPFAPSEPVSPLAAPTGGVSGVGIADDRGISHRFEYVPPSPGP